MELKTQSLGRVLGLLWRRAGRARFYLLGAAALLVLLALIGVTHLLSSRFKRDSRSSPENDAPSKTSTVSSETDFRPANPVIDITEVGSTESRGRNGELTVAVKIGVAARANGRPGEVEIRVAFFDVTNAGEMRPTDAHVDYKWLTAHRDWTDGTPKYLLATYVGAGSGRKSDILRYGGFLVRVFHDGQLQDERSEPKGLVAALHPPNAAGPATTTNSTPAARVAAPKTVVAPTSPPASVESVAANRETPSPPPPQPSRDTSALPYGSPVPDKAGFVFSPYNPKFLIDVRGFPPGTEVTDPNTGKTFKVP